MPPITRSFWISS
ncbi:hypothetical protein YPPY99_4481, partial [Yersinia pestis PY-99]